MFLLGMAVSTMAYSQNLAHINVGEMSISPPEFSVIGTIWQGHEIESINDFVGHFVEYPQGK